MPKRASRIHGGSSSRIKPRSRSRTRRRTTSRTVITRYRDRPTYSYPPNPMAVNVTIGNIGNTSPTNTDPAASVVPCARQAEIPSTNVIAYVAGRLKDMEQEVKDILQALNTTNHRFDLGVKSLHTLTDDMEKASDKITESALPAVEISPPPELITTPSSTAGGFFERPHVAGPNGEIMYQ